jgi:hypothetical protein
MVVPLMTWMCGDLKTLLALFLKQKRVRKFTWLDPRLYSVKKIRVQFSIWFNLVWKLVCNFMSLDNKWSKKKLVCNFTSLDTKCFPINACNQCNQIAISLPTWCPWSETLRNMTVGTTYREDGSEHDRF